MDFPTSENYAEQSVIQDAGARGLGAPHPSGHALTSIPYRDDWLLAQRAMDGCNDSAERILRECRPKVLAIMEHVCSGDSRSAEKSREIVADLFSECFGGRSGHARKDCLLALYGGKTNLTRWLVVCAKSRLKNWWRSAENRRMISLDAQPNNTGNGTGAELAGEAQMPVEEETVRLLADALAAAFAQLDARQQVFIRLVFLHGMQRERVAAFWGVHPSNVGRQISEGLDKIRASTLRSLRTMDPWLQINWADCLWIAENRSDVLHGETAAS